MDNMQIISRLIADSEYAKAIEKLDREIESHPREASLWFLRGRAYWGLGQKPKAISDYEEAAFLDPNSPAVLALEMARDVMDFYNPDLLNP